MNRLAIGLLALPLGACASLQTGGLDPSTANFIQQVGNYTSLACAFIPDAEAILSLVSKDPKIATAVGIANIICGTVGNQPVPPRGLLGAPIGGEPVVVPVPPTFGEYAGIVITGHRTR